MRIAKDPGTVKKFLTELGSKLVPLWQEEQSVMLRMKEEDFDKVIDVNLKGTFLVTQAAASLMKEQQLPGSIVNIASIVARTGNIGQANYTASKAGVIGFTKTAAKELGKFGIRVNVILPGFIKTPMTDVVPDKVQFELNISPQHS